MLLNKLTPFVSPLNTTTVELSSRIISAINADISVSIKDLDLVSSGELKVKGIGPKAIEDIKAYLRAKKPRRFKFGIYINQKGNVAKVARPSQRERKAENKIKEMMISHLELLQAFEGILFENDKFIGAKALKAIIFPGEYRTKSGDVKAIADKYKVSNRDITMYLGRFLLLDTSDRVDIYSKMLKAIYYSGAKAATEQELSRKMMHIIDTFVSEYIIPSIAPENYSKQGLDIIRLDQNHKVGELLLAIAKYLRVYETYTKSSSATGHSINYVSVSISDDVEKHLTKKIDKEPKTYSNIIENSLDGTYQTKSIYTKTGVKVKPLSQSLTTIDMLNKYTKIPIKLNEDVLGSKVIMEKVYSTFPNQKEVDGFKIWVENNRGKTLYINQARLIPDNGRVQLDGYFGGFQTGFRKIIWEFVEVEVIEPYIIEVIEDLIEELGDSSCPKDNCYMLRLKMYLKRIHNGEPVGLWLNLDNKMSGVQNMAVLTKSYDLAKASGMTKHMGDARDVLKDKLLHKYGNSLNLKIDKNVVKALLRGKMYGAGAKTTLESFLEDYKGSLVTLEVVEDFYNMLDEVMPELSKLQDYLYGMGKDFAKHGITNIQYTNLAGINCSISFYKNINLKGNTLLGNDRELTGVPVLDADSVGAKIVAALPQGGDATVLHWMVQEADCELFTIHDDFVFKANNYWKIYDLNRDLYRRFNEVDSLHYIVDQMYRRVSDITGVRYPRFKFGNLKSNCIEQTLYN